MEICSYSSPQTLVGGALAGPTTSTPDGSFFQFASSSCDYATSSASSTVMSTYTYGEIIIGTFSFLTFCLGAYAFFWFSFRRVKIKKNY